MNFNPAIMLDVLNWLETDGNNIIYIYGELDPWTAGAVEPSGQTNALKIVQADANHSITIVDLDEKALVYSTLESWLGIEINESGLPGNFQPPPKHQWAVEYPETEFLIRYLPH